MLDVAARNKRRRKMHFWHAMVWLTGLTQMVAIAWALTFIHTDEVVGLIDILLLGLCGYNVYFALKTLKRGRECLKAEAEGWAQCLENERELNAIVARREQAEEEMRQLKLEAEELLKRSRKDD